MSSYGGGPILQLTLCRMREFLREPEAIFWVFAFPILLAVALGLAFRSSGADTVRIAVEDLDGGPALATTLDAYEQVEVELLETGEAHEKLRTGRVALLVSPGDPVVFEFDSSRSESRLARLIVGNALQESAGRRNVLEVRERRITEPGSRYIDFLIPGLIGMNIMGTGLWGVGFRIVEQRKNKLIKRLVASPMRKSHFLLSHLLARIAFLVLEVGVVLAFGFFVLGVPIRGSLTALGFVALLGALAFAGIGLLVASRAKTIEGVSGLMNLVMVPMWIGSGVFFAYSNFPQAVQPFLLALPLTALNDALRGVMLDGTPLSGMIGLLAIVVAWGVGSFGVALKVFRWE